MAIPHFQLSSQSRRAGASCIAKAAYNAGVILHELSGQRQEYNKKGGIRFRALMYADSQEGQKKSREEFWQDVERGEKRKDACVSREIQAALPCELSYEQNRELARSFATKIIERYGLTAADLSIHYPSQHRRKSDGNFTARKPTASGHENPHFHLLFPDRNREGKKLRVFCHNPDELKDLRKLWENHVNEHLADAGLDCRISLDTLKKQIQDFSEEIEKLRAEENRIKSEIERIEKLEKLKTQEKKPMADVQQKYDRRARYMGIVGGDGGERIRRRMEGISFSDLPEPTRKLIAVIKRNIDAGEDNAGNYDILIQHLGEIRAAREANAQTTAPREGDAIIYQRHADHVRRQVSEDKMPDAIALRLRVCGHDIAEAVRIMRAGRMSADTAMHAAIGIYYTDRGDNAARNMSKHVDQWRKEERGQEAIRRNGGQSQTQTPQAAPAQTPQSGPRM